MKNQINKTMEEQNNAQTELEKKNSDERAWVSFPIGFLVLLFIDSMKDKVYTFFGIIINPDEGFFDKFKDFDFERISVSLLFGIMAFGGMIVSYFIVETLLVLITVNPTYRKYGGFGLFIIFGLSAVQLWITINHGGEDFFQWKGNSSPYRLESVCLLCLGIMFGTARLFFGVTRSGNENFN